MTHEEILAEYNAEYKHLIDEERVYFMRLPDLRTAIQKACRSIDVHTGERHAHQLRTPDRTLLDAEEMLLDREESIYHALSFDALFTALECVRDIERSGALLHHDVTRRIAFHRLIIPVNFVYLHTAAKPGAKALGITRKTKVNINAFPEPFNTLKGYQLEHLLEVYEEQLGGTSEE